MPEFYQTYLQRLWSDAIDDVTINDIKTVIKEVQEMDDEHGAFWVGLGDEEENILEAHKDLTIIGVFADDPETQIKNKAKSWNEIENLYALFLSGKVSEVRDILKQS